MWVHCHSDSRRRLGLAEEGPRSAAEHRGLRTITRATGRAKSRGKASCERETSLLPSSHRATRKSRDDVENRIQPQGGPRCPQSGFSLGIYLEPGSKKTVDTASYYHLSRRTPIPSSKEAGTCCVSKLVTGLKTNQPARSMWPTRQLQSVTLSSH